MSMVVSSSSLKALIATDLAIISDYFQRGYSNPTDEQATKPIFDAVYARLVRELPMHADFLLAYAINMIRANNAGRSAQVKWMSGCGFLGLIRRTHNRVIRRSNRESQGTMIAKKILIKPPLRNRWPLPA
jgi:hypothetical protein